jgi:hypothetical protein
MSVNVSTETFPVQIKDLPSFDALTNSDSLVVDRSGEYTGKIRIDVLTNYFFDLIGDAFTYYGESVAGAIVALSSDNTFYINNNSITFNKLSPDVQDKFRVNSNPTEGGSSLTGSISTFSSPVTAAGTTLGSLVTATGEFLVINVGGQYKALRLWDFPQN